MLKNLFLILCFYMLLIPTSAQDIPYQCPADFAGYLSPQQIIDEQSSTTTQLNLRGEPSTAQARLGVLLEGLLVGVMDGPRCNEGYVWWQVETDGLIGWVAEGRVNEYWLEPRGALIMVDERPYLMDSTGNVEPAGCARPPDDYVQVQLGYATLNQRTLAMLDNAQRIYEANGGEFINFRQAITQGSYNLGGVSASFGTHDGGGAVDISVRSYIDWRVLTDEIEPMVEALRIAGFAAWLRDTGELYPNSPIHIHAIAVGDAELSPIARKQIDGEMGYLRGFNGLPQEEGILPIEDGHDGPVICGWMHEMGFDDLREPGHFFERGQIFFHQEDYQRVIENVTTAIDLLTGDPRFYSESQFYALRGDAHYELGNLDAALVDYEQALELDLSDSSLEAAINARVIEIKGQ